MKKKMIAGASVIALLAAGLTFSPQIHQWLDEMAKVRAIQERYDRALKTAVSYQDSNPAGSSKLTDWIFDIADPRTAPLAQWDNPGDKPQMIIQIRLVEEPKKSGLYTKFSKHMLCSFHSIKLFMRAKIRFLPKKTAW